MTELRGQSAAKTGARGSSEDSTTQSNTSVTYISFYNKAAPDRSRMPSTRSQGRSQPQLQFPRRKSCRASTGSKTTNLDKSPLPARTVKPPNRDENLPLSPRRTVSLTPLSPRRPTDAAAAPGQSDRLPLSPRKRAGDENVCNVLRGSPPKQSRPSPLASPRKPAFDENSSPSARRRLLPAQSPRRLPLSPAHKASPRRQETPTGSPSKPRLGSDKNAPVVRLFNDKSRFLNVKRALHTAVPERLLSRDTERGAIRAFLEEKLLQKKPGSLYISGAPGTGKTACLSCVLQEMESELSSAQTVTVNCMTLRSSHAVFSVLSEKLKVPDAGQSGLQRCLTAAGRPVLLVLDEMDQLDSKAQDVLYTIFEWPHLQKSRLCLIGIANALDLTDRILPRLQARPECRPLLLNFPPYSRQELTAIVQDRLAQASAENLLDSMAVQFCARKVSAVSGDARKALDICRRAVEMVESDERKKAATDSSGEAKASRVSVPQVARVLSEVYGDRMAAQSEGESFPLQQKLLVCCLLLLIRNGKSKEIPLGKLHEVYSRLCAQRQVSAAGQSECLSLCSLLESRGIFALKKAKEARLTKIFLKIEERDVENALKDRTLLGSILAAGLP